VVVGMVPMVLGKLYLPLSLRGDEKILVATKKKKEILRNYCSKKKA